MTMENNNNYVYIYTNKNDNTVRNVSIHKYNKTEEEIVAEIEKYNANENSTWKVTRFQLDPTLFEAVKFLLGEDEYCGTYEIKSLLDKLSEVRDDIDILSNDIYRSMNFAESVINRVNEYISEKKKGEEEDE